jgi:hypothetical protein
MARGSTSRSPRLQPWGDVTTFLVFWMLLYQQTGSGQIAHRFFERTLETLAGVAIAYFFGLLVPRALEGYAQRRAARHAAGELTRQGASQPQPHS